MAEKHHIRMCALGSETDMTHLLHVLLDNAGALEEEDPDAPRKTRAELEAQVHQLAQWEGAPENGFVYDTISTVPYGSAEMESTSLTIRREACGLWTACFDYISMDRFQAEDWMALHQRCGRLLMVGQYASRTFGLEQGGVMLCGGRVVENWETMDETWMWLIHQYECGYPPEEAVQRLAKLADTLADEDSDWTIDELLERCIALLEERAAAVADPEAVRAELCAALDKRDYQTVLAIQVDVAESVLWQTEHNNKWLANLRAVLAAWQAE